MAINIALSLILISAISISVWAYQQYKGGTQRAANFAALHMNDFCDMHYRNIDKWLQEAEDKGEPWGTPEQIKEAKLNMNVTCVKEDFEPYARKAAEDYYKASGLELFPEEDSSLQ